jgi:hypothetical protein
MLAAIRGDAASASVVADELPVDVGADGAATMRSTTSSHASKRA